MRERGHGVGVPITSEIVASSSSRSGDTCHVISVSHRHTRSHRKSCQPQLRVDTNKENKSGGVVGNKDQCQTTLVGARQGLCSKGEHYCATHRYDFSFASRLARNCCKCSCTLGFRLRAKHPEALIGCWRARCAVHSLVSKLEAGILAGKPLIPDLRSMHDIVNLRHGQVRHPSFKRTTTRREVVSKPEARGDIDFE